MSGDQRCPTAEIVLNWNDGVEVRAEIADPTLTSPTTKRRTREYDAETLTSLVVECGAFL